MGVVVTYAGNTKATEKFKDFKFIIIQQKIYNQRMLIGMFGFYSPWILFYDYR